MRQLIRLLRYVRSFRLLLIGPILDRVLNPTRGFELAAQPIVLFHVPGTSYDVLLRHFVPPHFQNPWTMVAFVLVMATLLKGLCEYAGSYLVNYAGFGLITQLRDDLYTS